MEKIIISIAVAFTLISCGSSTNYTVYGGHSATSTNSLSVTEKMGAGEPSSVKIKMYAAWLCPGADCTSCTKLTDYGDTPQEKELYATKPILFEGAPADGTYNCVVIKMSDMLTFTPSADAVTKNPGGNCDSTKEFTFDFYRAGSDGDSGWKDINGNIITPHGSPTAPVEDTVYLFMSTDPSKFVAPNVFTLLTAATVPGNGTFVMDFTNRVSTYYAGNFCWLEGFVPSFK